MTTATHPVGVTGFAALLAHRAADTPDALAYEFSHDGAGRSEQLSYRELYRRALGVAHLLRADLQPGDRVLLLLPPGPAYLAALYGCFIAGLIGVSAPPPQPRRLAATLSRLGGIAASAGIRGVLTTAPVRGAAEEHLDLDGFRSARWFVTDDAEATNDDAVMADGAADDVTFLQYTSGSTGAPRGVMLTHANLLANSASIASAFGHDRDSRGMSWLPPFHDMGLIGGVLQPMYVGFPVLLMSPTTVIKRPALWLQAISDFRATTSGGPNFAYDLCVRRTTPEERERLDLSSWRLAFNGAEPIQPATLDRFAATFGPCGFSPAATYPCYGLAEATLLVTGGDHAAPWARRSVDPAALRDGLVREATHDALDQELVGCGTPDAEHEVVVVDVDARQPAAPDAVGEIWVRGPSVARGYWEDEAATAATFLAELAGRPGVPFLRTGDLGAWVDGELVVVGRAKELLIVSGQNHHPHDLEQAAEQASPALRPHCSAAYSIPAADGRPEGVGVLLEVAPDTSQPEEIVRAVRRALASNAHLQPDRVTLTTPRSVPKTTSGKIQRTAVPALLASEEIEIVFDWRKGDD